jgi:serine/arginine repetitive matrix protein 1
VDPRQLQISLTGFLEKNTSLFCRELWQLLVSANQTGTGIPQRFLDEKAEELRRQKEEQERVQVGRGAPVERLRCGLLKGLLGG